MNELGRYMQRKYGRTEPLTAGERHENKLELQRKWRAKNQEKVRAYGRKGAEKRRTTLPEKVRAYKKQQYQKHKEYYKEKSRLWRLHNRERFLEQQRKAYKKVKEYIQSFKNKPRCIGCTCILKENEKTVCAWCISTYSHKYANIHT